MRLIARSCKLVSDGSEPLTEAVSGRLSEKRLYPKRSVSGVKDVARCATRNSNNERQVNSTLMQRAESQGKNKQRSECAVEDYISQGSSLSPSRLPLH